MPCFYLTMPDLFLSGPDFDGRPKGVKIPFDLCVQIEYTDCGAKLRTVRCLKYQIKDYWRALHYYWAKMRSHLYFVTLKSVKDLDFCIEAIPKFQCWLPPKDKKCVWGDRYVYLLALNGGK